MSQKACTGTGTQAQQGSTETGGGQKLFAKFVRKAAALAGFSVLEARGAAAEKCLPFYNPGQSQS